MNPDLAVSVFYSYNLMVLARGGRNEPRPLNGA
jgi:hypothetical protein